uniref:restriction endonuclease subunit S n=1 Tax=Microbulbifer agarilyticus TaxID=260552 RepID=UPI0002558A31|nr:restriction endonuclease subunit S [Microbulbifer agarilyticus]
MGSEWTTIGEIAEVFDGPHATPKKIEEGPYFLSISSLEKGRLDLSKSARISEEQFVKWTKRVTPEEDDVLFSYETRLGEAALMPSGIRACLGRRMGLLRPKRDKVDPRYLLFAYLGPDFQREIFARTNSGATVDRIALKELPSFPIRIPSLPEQKKVSAIIGALDDKIEVSRKINTTLESMAQALFKSWFVDFDPVIDNALAAGNSIPDALQARARARQEMRTATGATAQPLPAEIQQLFPSSFVFTEKMGWIPDGWEFGVLEDLLVLQRGFDLPKSSRTDGEFALMAASGQDGTHNEFKVSGPGITTGRSGKLGEVCFVERDFWPLNTTLWVKEFKRSSPYHAYYLLKSMDLEKYNSGSAVPTLNRNYVHNVSVVLPPKDLVSAYDKFVSSLYTKRYENEAQNQTLENVRDSLLPKLLSGQLEIPEAEQQLAEVI